MSHRQASPPPARPGSAPPRPSSAPERVGRYRLARRISRGGMAEVFEAYLEGEGGFARRFAVKVPLKETALQELAAFADEARILSQLHHPGIVGVVDFGTHEGWPYQVLDFVDGPDLAQLRMMRGAEENLTPTLALLIVLEAARALHYAHEATDWQGRRLGVVHRDISPHNILVSWSGDVKLIDFGIALSEGRLAKTQEGFVKGKLAYMAPEQIGGQRVTPRSDVFSLGCVLYFMLTGDSPYSTDEARERAARELRPSWLGDLDPDVGEIIERAVELRPDRRHESALELANACERALASRPDATAAALPRCLAGLRGAPSSGAGRPLRRDSSVVVVGADPQEEARTVASLALESPTRAVATSRPPPSSVRVGRYRVLDPIPGWDDLFRAAPSDEAASEPVGLKTIPCRDLAADEMARRLADAARMRTLDHEHVLRVRELGVDADVLYIAVDEPSGLPLDRVLQDVEAIGGLRREEIVALSAGLLSAVEAARSASEARDIRRETFLLSWEGLPKLMDTIVDGPRAGLRDPRAADVGALVQLIESLPCAEGVGAPLREAGAVLGGRGGRAGSRSSRTRRESVEASVGRPPSAVLAGLMLRLYGSGCDPVDVSSVSFDARLRDTAPIPLAPFSSPAEAGLVTEIDLDETGARDEVLSATRCASRSG